MRVVCSSVRVISTGCSRREEGTKRSCSRDDEVEGLEVALEALADARPDHLDRDPAGCRRRPQRRQDAPALSRQRLSRVRSGEKFLHRTAERLLHPRPRQGFEREGRHVVLQLGEFQRHVVAHDVGPRRQELAELDVGGAEPLDRAGKTVRRSAGCAWPREEASEAVPQSAPPASPRPGSEANTPSRSKNEPPGSVERCRDVLMKPEIRASSRSGGQRCRRNSSPADAGEAGALDHLGEVPPGSGTCGSIRPGSGRVRRRRRRSSPMRGITLNDQAS